jgi:hypothetical protein
MSFNLEKILSLTKDEKIKIEKIAKIQDLANLLISKADELIRYAANSYDEKIKSEDVIVPNIKDLFNENTR